MTEEQQYRFANIIIDISHENVDRLFQYKIPEDLLSVLEPGMCVSIPFGKGNQLRNGVVMERTSRADYPVDRLKEIVAVVPDSVTVSGDAIRLAAWMKRNYGSTMIAALKTVLPAKQAYKPRIHKSVIRLQTQEQLQESLAEAVRKKQSAKIRILTELMTEAILPYELVSGKLHISPATLGSLERQGVIEVRSESGYRNPVRLKPAAETAKQLSEEQSAIINEITREYTQGIRGTYLIHGITGSGKTEVYISLIKNIVSMGKQCIVLIPEIALTYQTLLRFYKKFGDRVSVMHSSLSKGEKYDQCERARRGDIDVIIGPRSALFVPFPRLGMIIIDEEHEPSYKSESMPRYHARETAQALAVMKSAALVLGSATPSLEAYFRAREGKYKMFSLTRRLTGGTLPTVYTVDLRNELQAGNRSIFSRKLQELITARLAAGEQIILFLNRRGYAGFVSCRSCGHVMKCPHCDVSLAKHKGGRLLCHYCGYATTDVTRCPECGSGYILGFRAGTQQIEETINKMWPAARVLRMDGDTTKKKDSLRQILTAFSEGQADILIGTQMIVKGHDFPGVTLVGIIAADLSLNANDYRAGERTFQLLTQAAGRAGRGDKPGEVVIQTYRPEHYSIVRAAEQDYEKFYEEEIIYRQLASYPPASHMLAIVIGAADAEAGKHLGEEMAGSIRASGSSARIIGPAEASVSKIKDIYRFVLYIKHADYQELVKVKDIIEEKMNQGENRKETVQFDFDPMDRI